MGLVNPLTETDMAGALDGIHARLSLASAVLVAAYWVHKASQTPLAENQGSHTRRLVWRSFWSILIAGIHVLIVTGALFVVHRSLMTLLGTR